MRSRISRCGSRRHSGHAAGRRSGQPSAGQLPQELKLLGEKMVALGDIGPEAIMRSVEGFVAKTERLGIDATTARSASMP
jgi:hypothetical protein